MTKPSVFISYSHKDKKWVKDYLVTNLEKNGIPCHIDYRDFEIGTASLINMEQAVEKCKKTILVFTPDWVNSEFTTFEGLMLQTDDPSGLRKRIFPIMLHKCTPPKRLKIFTFADFTDKAEWDTQLERVIKQIKKDFEKIELEKKTYPTLKAHHIDITRLPQTGFELFGRHKELTLLNEAWESGATNIVSFVAYGGVGKSTLVNKWVEKMRWDNYRGAEKVYAWSFYSQGTGERVTSADMFINNALEWFWDADPKQGSPWDKGKRLAKLINIHKTLLILDGLEPLQSAEKVEKGKIKDPALATLVAELAKNNKGLCLITTREHVSELDRYTKKTKQLDLEHISDEAGRKLLEMRRIFGSEKELERLVQQFGNHALAINLLAEYIRIFKNHPLEKANNIPDLNIPDEQGKHAHRIIEAFANRFGSASAEFQLLSILGLFDRPVPIDAINAIIRDNPVPGLSDKITDTSGSGWLTTLENLRKHKLLFKKSEHHPDTLDCHPLIREHFDEKLQQQNPDVWKQAHARLYEYYKNLPEKKLPDTLGEMVPLYNAVRHGCAADLHNEALMDVYWERICRKQEFYSTDKLGIYGIDLAAITCFFEIPWEKPAVNLLPLLKANVLSWAGFRLIALGRLKEAIRPINIALQMRIQQVDWMNCATNAGLLSELYLLIGDAKKAVIYGKISVEYADKTGDAFKRVTKRTNLAAALHYIGKSNEALQLFQQAEKMQRESNPQDIYLTSLQGFRFCNLLIEKGEYEEVIKRSYYSLKITKNVWLLDSALDTLNLGRAYFLKSISTKEEFTLTKAKEFLNKAVEDLRNSTNQMYLPLGLIARASFYLHKKEFNKAQNDLDEAKEIAEWSGMKFYFSYIT